MSFCHAQSKPSITGAQESSWYWSVIFTAYISILEDAHHHACDHGAVSVAVVLTCGALRESDVPCHGQVGVVQVYPSI
jgi:hypothetical protein